MHKAVPIALETWDIDAAMAAFLSLWAPALEDNAADWEGSKNMEKHNERCAKMSLMHFIHTHKGGKSLYSLIPDIKGNAEVDEQTSDYEIPWALDIGLRVPLVGRFDGFCKHRDTGETWIWELKTTSQLTSNFFEAHEMFPQNLVYCLAGSAAIGMNVQGVMLEGMHIHKSKVENQCHPLLVSGHHMEDIMKWLQRTGQQILDMEDQMSDDMDAEPWIKDFSGCTPLPHYYIPGWRCDYADLCRYPEWQTLLGMYREVPDHKFLKITFEGQQAS